MSEVADIDPVASRIALERRAREMRAAGLLQDGADEPPPSPCINVCRMDDPDRSNPSRQCLGCFRRIGEIVEWGGASASRKREIWRALLQRAQLE